MKSLFIFVLFFLSNLAFAKGGFFAWKNTGRQIHVYLPDGYFKSKTAYPVLYVHDGQNLYDPARAFLGQTWKAEETLNSLIAQKKIEPIILVAIDNSSDRLNEYTHDYDASEHGGGKAHQYLAWIKNVLKPEVDLTFRTKTKVSALMGSSLGGLVSLYGGLLYPETFTLIAALSPSLWWNQGSLFSLIENSDRLPLKIYADSGTLGGEKPEDVLKLKSLLEQMSYSAFYASIQEGANHSEKYWAQRLPLALQTLFPAKK